MREELKPCPFCGGKVSMEKNCVKCIPCAYELVFQSRKFYSFGVGVRTGRELMRETWNRRTANA